MHLGTFERPARRGRRNATRLEGRVEWSVGVVGLEILVSLLKVTDRLMVIDLLWLPQTWCCINSIHS